MAWTKSILVVDDDVDVHDERAVLEACAKHCDPLRDIELVRGPLDILDHAAPHLAAGSKIGFDCTRRWDNEDAGRGPLPPPEARARALAAGPASELARTKAMETPGVIEAQLPEACPGWMLVRVERGFGEPDGAGLGRQVAGSLARELVRLGPSVAPPFTVVVGRDVDLTDPSMALFHWLANSDPGRDLVRSPSEAPTTVAVFDATPKTEEDAASCPEPVRAWPPVLEIDARSRARTDGMVEGLTSPP